jgi:hypothetical protein
MTTCSPLRWVLLGIGILFLLSAFLWCVIQGSIQSQLTPSTCTIVSSTPGKLYVGDPECATNVYECTVGVAHTVGQLAYVEKACNFGNECYSTCGSSSCAVYPVDFTACRKYLAASLTDSKDACANKYATGTHSDCWYIDSDPHRVTLEFPYPSLWFSLFLWIPGLVFVAIALLLHYRHYQQGAKLGSVARAKTS